MQNCLIKTKEIIQQIQIKQNIDYKKSPLRIKVELNLCNAFKQILTIQEHILLIVSNMFHLSEICCASPYALNII